MGFLVSAAATLATIAGSLLLSKTQDFIEERRSSKEGMSPVDLSGTVDLMLKEARSKGSQVYDKLLNKLSALPSNYIQSDTVKKLIRDRRLSLNSQINKVSDLMNKVESSAAPIQSKLESLKYMSNSFRNSDAGRQYFENIKGEAQTLANNASEILKGVEKDV